MGKLYNLAKVSTATVGAGTITLGSAVSGFLTFAQAGVADGDVVSYGISDGSNGEVGTGTYTSAGTTLSRTPTASTNGNAAISLSGAALVFITARAEDLKSQGIAGAARNLKITRGSATTLTITADEIFTETALGGFIFKEAGSISHTLTIGGTGANGMDTGSAPTSGYLAVYAITKGDGATYAVLGYSLGVFAAGTAAPTIYPGANMPAGYAASALIGIWPTNGSAQLVTGVQVDRKFYYSTPVNVFSGSGPATLTSQSISGAVPASARTADCIAGNNGGIALNYRFVIAGDSAGTGMRAIDSNNPFGSNGNYGPLSLTAAYSLVDIPIITAQTIFIQDSQSRANDQFYVNAFTW